MDLKKDLNLVYQKNFKLEFRIENFEMSSNFERQFIPTHMPDRSLGVAILGKGNLQEDQDYVIFSLQAVDQNFYIGFLNCCCILSILDADGEKRLPRTFEFFTHVRHRYHYLREKRYVKRASILNNSSELLQEGTLTVIVEGTLDEWSGSLPAHRVFPAPQHCSSSFEVFESPDLKVYLRKDSVYGKKLREHSKVFRDMWRTPMRESQETSVLLQNEELPVFLNMLVFLDTKQLDYSDVSKLHLYIMADKYDIPILLEECRSIIENFYLQETLTYALDVIRRYDRKGALDNTADVQSQEIQACHSNSETGDSLEEDTTAHKEEKDYRLHIKTREQFDYYLNSFRKKMEKRRISSSVLEYWTPEKIACDFKTVMNDNYLEVYLRKDSEHVKFLMEYSSVFRKRVNSPSTEKYIQLENTDLHEIVCMLCFVETKQLILHRVSQTTLYRIAYEYDVPALHKVCRKNLLKSEWEFVCRVLEFARFYNDKQLERAAESSCKRLQEIEGCPHYEARDEADIYTLFNELSNGRKINSKKEFLTYLDTLWGRMNKSPEASTPKGGVPHIQVTETESDSESFDFYR